MLVKTTTWNRGKEDLYSHLSTNFKTSEDMSSSNFLNFFSTKDTVSTHEADQNPNSYLFGVFFTEYQLLLPKPKALITIPLRPGKDRYRLSEGDTLFLGNFKLKVREISFLNNRSAQGDVYASEFATVGVGSPPKSLKSINKTSDYCKVCLEEEQVCNPVIKPCKCSDGIHIVCLRTWLTNKMSYEAHANVSFFRWTAFECEICKEKYPSSIQVENKKYDLTPIIKPRKDYIVLESNDKEKVIVVAAFRAKKKLVIGSNKSAHICLKNYPVSNFHAVLKAEKDTVTIEDANSRYGTLVKVDKNIVIDSKIRIQCKNHLFRIRKKLFMKKSRTCAVFGCLGRLKLSK